MPKSIWSTRFPTPKAVTFDEALKISGWGQDADEDGDDWITIHGAHVLVGANGEVKSGAGGKFNGSNYKKAKAGENKQGAGDDHASKIDALNKDVKIKKFGDEKDGCKKVEVKQNRNRIIQRQYSATEKTAEAVYNALEQGEQDSLNGIENQVWFDPNSGATWQTKFKSDTRANEKASDEYYEKATNAGVMQIAYNHIDPSFYHKDDPVRQAEFKHYKQDNLEKMYGIFEEHGIDIDR